MAGQGFAPKGPGEARHRKTTEFTVVESDGKQHGAPLPNSFDWPAETLAWWETWRTSALASRFTETDWSFLVDTAVLHAEFWLGNRSVAAELRLRVAKFGATPEDRARLRVSVGEPAGPPSGSGPKSPRLKRKTAQRRGRLLNAVEDGKSATG